MACGGQGFWGGPADTFDQSAYAQQAQGALVGGGGLYHLMAGGENNPVHQAELSGRGRGGDDLLEAQEYGIFCAGGLLFRSSLWGNEPSLRS